MTSYGELLRDPRWQRKRLEIMQRADFRCEQCGTDRITLNVHHLRYFRGRNPWEYEGRYLVCLCEPCHALQHPEKQKALTPLSAILPVVLARVVEDRYDPAICIVCYASFRVTLTRCADCATRMLEPGPVWRENAA